MRWLYNGAMPNIQVKNVPENTHRVFRRRAAMAGKSLQEYMLDFLESNAERSTLDEALDHIEQLKGGTHMTFEESARLIREDRESH